MCQLHPRKVNKLLARYVHIVSGIGGSGPTAASVKTVSFSLDWNSNECNSNSVYRELL